MAQWLSAYPAPTGEEINLIDPPDQLGGNIALHTVCLMVATAFVALRTYTRIYITEASFSIEDYLCLWSYCLACAFSALILKSCTLGLGRDIWNEPSTWLFDALKYFTFAQYVYILLSGSIRLVFLFFYRNVFSRHSNKAARAAVYFGIIAVIIINVGTFFATIFDCLPVSKAWNALLPGHCIQTQILPWVQGITSLVTDVYVFVLPIPFLWNLQVSRGKKTRVIAVFGVGAFVCVASIVRLAKTPILFSFNATNNLSKICLWATLEVYIGLICSCLVFLPAFLERYTPASIKSSLSSIWSRSRRTSQNSTKAGDSQGQHVKLQETKTNSVPSRISETQGHVVPHTQEIDGWYEC